MMILHTISESIKDILLVYLNKLNTLKKWFIGLYKFLNFSNKDLKTNP